MSVNTDYAAQRLSSFLDTRPHEHGYTRLPTAIHLDALFHKHVKI